MHHHHHPASFLVWMYLCGVCQHTSANTLRSHTKQHTPTGISALLPCPPRLVDRAHTERACKHSGNVTGGLQLSATANSSIPNCATAWCMHTNRWTTMPAYPAKHTAQHSTSQHNTPTHTIDCAPKHAQPFKSPRHKPQTRSSCEISPQKSSSQVVQACKQCGRV